MAAALELDRLTKTYGSAAVVDRLSLSVPEGSVFGFLGPNGAGKTTTIRMILGLVRPTSGSARVLGLDSQRDRARIASLVGAIVETPTFYDGLTARETLVTLSYAAGLSPSAKKNDELLSLMGLAAAAGRKVNGFSLGMKQRLGIAVALLGNPKLLFLDEPTNGLDPDGAREVREVLEGLRGGGRTIFLSSHLLHEVERVCTHAAIVQKGTLRCQGSVADLLASSGHELRVSSVARALELLGGLASADAAQSAAGWLLLRGGEEQVPAALRVLLSGGVDVFEVRPKRTSLEQVFFEDTSSKAA